MDRSRITRAHILIRRWFREILIGGSEMALAIGLVLFSGLAFLGILLLSFPKGTGLVELYSDLVRAGPDAPRKRQPIAPSGSWTGTQDA